MMNEVFLLSKSLKTFCYIYFALLYSNTVIYFDHRRCVFTLTMACNDFSFLYTYSKIVYSSVMYVSEIIKRVTADTGIASSAPFTLTRII